MPSSSRRSRSFSLFQSGSKSELPPTRWGDRRHALRWPSCRMLLDGFAVPPLPSCSKESRRTRPCRFRCATAAVMLAQSRRTRPCGFRRATASISWLTKIAARCAPGKLATCLLTRKQMPKMRTDSRPTRGVPRTAFAAGPAFVAQVFQELVVSFRRQVEGSPRVPFEKHCAAPKSSNKYVEETRRSKHWLPLGIRISRKSIQKN